MKKTLLLGALLAAAAMPASADYSEYFTLSYHGEEIANGGTVVIRDYSEDNVAFEGHIQVTNKKAEAQKVSGAMLFTGNPSSADVSADMMKWGTPAFCYSYTGEGLGTCLGGVPPISAGSGIVDLPAPGNDLLWEIHIYMAPKDLVCEYDLEMYPTVREDDPDGEFTDPETGDNYNIIELTDSKFLCHLKFDANAAVEDVELDENAPAEYYTLQGVRVENPEKGIYIVRRGAKVEKVAID